MMRWSRWLSLCQVLFLVPAATVWAAEAPGDAATLFASKCAACHGKDGKGNAAMAKMFKIDPAKLDQTSKGVQALTDAQMADRIKNGVNKMPAYKDKLTDAQIASLVGYVRSLAKPPAQ